MALSKLKDSELEAVHPQSMAMLGIRERQDLQPRTGACMMTLKQRFPEAWIDIAVTA